MIYWDTSCVIKLYANESDSERWLNQMIAYQQPLLSSSLLQVELSYALKAKEQRGELVPGGAEKLVDRFDADVQLGRYRLMACGASLLERAAALALHHPDAGRLRTLDGLHLATALESRCDTIATTDTGLAAAAESAGLTLLG